MKSLLVLSLQISDVKYEEIYAMISDAIQNHQKLVIMYAGAHILSLAQEMPDLQTALSCADIVHPDGVGVWLAAKYLHGRGFRDRFNWSDHVYEFLATSATRSWRIFILGSTTETLNKATLSMQRDVPQIGIVGAKNGFEDADSANLIDEINKAHPDILWVGMGSPKQELWIHRHRNELQCNVIQSVGDAISLLAGEKIRGPKIFQLIGLEWAFRILFHPRKYFSRYAFGIPFFAATIVKQKFRSKKCSP